MKKMILMGVPHHNNLGDNAIAIAERKYLQDNFKKYKYFELPEETLDVCSEKVKKYVNEEDLIFLHGGGNLGDEYLYIEEGRRKVIQMFPQNVIVLFPETIYFSNTIKGKMELNKSKEIYQKHKKLLLIARDEISYQIMKKEFSKNIILKTPDIVTYLNETKDNFLREGVLLILRNDIESKLTGNEVKDIERIVKNYFEKIEHNDTAKGKGILENKRKQRLNEMLDKYRSSKLIITDRLHGMIFAAITSTPCIAIDNYNHKIKGCSETFKHLDYIKYVDNLNNLDETIKYLLKTQFKKYDNTFAHMEFRQIKERIKEFQQ